MIAHTRHVIIVINSGLLIGLFAYVAEEWREWFRSSDKVCLPRWRSRFALTGFGISTLSLLMQVVVWTEAAIRLDGRLTTLTLYPLIFLGFWVSVLACAVGTIGKGMLRRPAVLSSLGGLALWIVTAWLFTDQMLKEVGF